MNARMSLLYIIRYFFLYANSMHLNTRFIQIVIRILILHWHFDWVSVISVIVVVLKANNTFNIVSIAYFLAYLNLKEQMTKERQKRTLQTLQSRPMCLLYIMCVFSHFHSCPHLMFFERGLYCHYMSTQHIVDIHRCFDYNWGLPILHI
jgi:hypothetical protein